MNKFFTVLIKKTIRRNKFKSIFMTFIDRNKNITVECILYFFFIRFFHLSAYVPRSFWILFLNHKNHPVILFLHFNLYNFSKSYYGMISSYLCDKLFDSNWHSFRIMNVDPPRYFVLSKPDWHMLYLPLSNFPEPNNFVYLKLYVVIFFCFLQYSKVTRAY